jgi:hypothetical protein
MPSIVSRRRLSRRTLLRGAGVALSLPWLDAMVPAFARSSESESPRRFVSVSQGLGLHGPNLFPEDDGPNYTPSVYMSLLADISQEVSVISGVSHPGVNAGHQAEASILTAAPVTRASANGFRNSISLDQLMARHLGNETRFPSLVLNAREESSPSYTENGAMIPAENSPLRVFQQLFVDDTPEERERQAARMKQGRNIMDLVGLEAKALQRELGESDRVKLDDYFSSVRQLEGRLAANEDWAHKPKPKVEAAPPDLANIKNMLDRERAMLDLMKLALETDSTRFITLHMDGANEVFPIEGVDEGYHSLSHHGKDPEKLAQLTRVESEFVKAWGDFVRSLKATPDGADTLLDRTMVMLTSNLGNASSHDNKNMPLLLAGGGFRHGRHLAFDREQNYPLPNLYVQMLQRLGLEFRSFSTNSTAESVPGLEMV